MLDKYFTIVVLILSLTMLFTLGGVEGASQLSAAGFNTTNPDGPLCLLLLSLGLTALFLPRRKSSNTF